MIFSQKVTKIYKMSNESEMNYDNYFPDFNEINLDIQNITESVFEELSQNRPTEKNSREILDIYNFCKEYNPKEVQKIEIEVKRLNEAELMQIIDDTELMNFKLIIDYKNIYGKFSSSK